MGEPPSEEDYLSVLAAMRVLTDQGWRECSLNEAIDQWATVVSIVEEGYTMTVDDYTNDLSIREWPELARPHLTARLCASMDERLLRLDARFRNATVEACRKLPGGGAWWWYQRLPKVLIGELAEDAARMRLLATD